MEKKRCGAKKKDGTPCQTYAMPNGRCRIHGGATPSGIASPQFKTGRYSKHLPTRLMARYQEAQTDTELLALREEVALVDTRLSELLGRVDSGESAQRWQQAQKAFDELRKARITADAKQFASAMDELERTLINGDDYGLWSEVATMLDLRKRLVESERKRLVEMQQMITSERAMILLTTVIGIIRTHVTDRDALAAISVEFRKLAMAEPSQ